MRNSIIFSSASLLSFNCSSRCEKSVSPVVLLSSSFCNQVIVCSTYISRCLACFALLLEQRSDFSRTFSFIISQKREGLTDSSFLYSLFIIVVLIWFIYSNSVKKDVFNFRKPGPRGFECSDRRSVIIEWSVL